MIKLVTLAPNMEGSEEFIRELHNEVVISNRTYSSKIMAAQQKR